MSLYNCVTFLYHLLSRFSFGNFRTCIFLNEVQKAQYLIDLQTIFLLNKRDTWQDMCTCLIMECLNYQKRTFFKHLKIVLFS